VTTTYPLAVGQDGRLTYSVAHTNTFIDEVRVWRRALTAADVLAEAKPLCVASSTAASYPSDLATHLRFSEGVGSVTQNSGSVGGLAFVAGGSGSWGSEPFSCDLLSPSSSPVASISASPTPVLSPSPSSSSSRSSAPLVPLSYVFFNSAGDYVSVPRTAAVDFGTTVSFTLSLYVQGTAPSTSDACLLCQKDWSRGSYASWALALDGTQAWFNIGDGTTAGRRDIRSYASVMDNAWHHVAVVVDRSSGGFITLYVDGAVNSRIATGSLGSVSTARPIAVGASQFESLLLFVRLGTVRA
jgi:hypothetical protein